MKIGHIVLPIGVAFCLFGSVSSGMALFSGMAIGLLFGNPYLKATQDISKKLIAICIVAIGAGLNLEVVATVGVQGLTYTLVGIVGTLIVGIWMSKHLGVPKDCGLLISVGTAICGGSAVMAVGTTMGAKQKDMSLALITVLCLNAVALFIFPPVGNFFDLSQHQFGLWSALAIHDTSSVVGAAMTYGSDALIIATVVKLARALWIVPTTILTKILRKTVSHSKHFPIPWFIVGFILAAALVTYIPQLRSFGHIIEGFGKRGMILVLFLVGAQVTRPMFKESDSRVFIVGLLLWIIVASTSLFAILRGFIA